MWLCLFNLFIIQVVNGFDPNNFRCPACPPCDIEKRSEGFQWTPVPNMGLCMYGYDPFEMDPLLPGQPDPGIKKRIFEPTFWSEEQQSMTLYPNVDYADDINCNIKQKTTVVKTMSDLMEAMSGSFSFSETQSMSSNSNMPFGPLLFISYKKSKSSRKSKEENSNFEVQSKFFEESNGEAYINRADCIVYRVTINPFSRPTFTDGFINALRELHYAAKNPETSHSKWIRRKFIQNYGINYFSECFLGASMKTVTRISRKSRSQKEQSQRQECVASAYEEGKSKGVKVNEFDISVEKGPAKIGTTLGGWGVGSENAFANASTQCDVNSKSKSFFNEIGLS